MTDALRTFCEISLTGAVMICLVWAFRAMFSKRMNHAIIVTLWITVLLRLCIPFTIESPIHAGDIITLPQAVSSAPQEADPRPVIDPVPAISSGEIVEEGGTGAYTDTGLVGMENTETDQEAEPTVIEKFGEWIRGIPIWNTLTLAWAAGTLWVLLWTIYQAVVFRQKFKRGCEVTDDAILDALEEYKKELGIKRRIRVWQYGCVDTPAIFGYFRPYLLLPTDFVQEAKGEKLRHVLLHELCHIRRQDILTGYLWLIAKALHWFNPLVWAAYRLYRDDVELCCDRMVIRYLKDGDPYAYSQTLIDVVRSSKRNAVTAAMSLCENKQRLKERVIRMLNPGKRSGIAVAVSLMLALVMLIGCFTTACRVESGKILVIDPSDEIVYADGYVDGQDSQYWYTNHCFDCMPMADAGDAYYFMAGPTNGFLYRMDKATGEMAPVCNKPGCGHGDDYDPSQNYMDSDCTAFLGPHHAKALMYYRGRLFCLEDTDHGDKLFEISLAGDAQKELRTLTQSRYVRSIAIHRGYVYYADASSSGDGTQITTSKMFRLPIEDLDVEPELIHTVEGYLPACGRLLCYGNYVYFTEYYGTDADRNYTIRRLNRYNVKTGKIEIIVDDGVGAYYTIFDGRLAYYSLDGTCLYDLDGKHKKRISDHTGVLSSSGGYLLIDNLHQKRIYANMNISRTVYAYDTDGNYAGSTEIDDLDCYPYPVGAVNGLYFVPTFDTETQTYTMYSMSVDKIVDGTAVPEVFYQGEPRDLDITVSP